jgi:hypothetical protein
MLNNFDKLSNNNHNIDLISLNKFLLEKGDNFLENLIDNNKFIKKEDITKEFFQKKYRTIFDGIFSVDDSFSFTGEDFPVEYYNEKIIKNLVEEYNKFGKYLLFLNSKLDIYFQLAKYTITTKASWMLIYIPKTIENYYSLVKLAFEKDNNIIREEWFPKEYIPKLINDYPQNTDFLKKYLLKEYISKEVRKFLKEYYLNKNKQ